MGFISLDGPVVTSGDSVSVDGVGLRVLLVTPTDDSIREGSSVVARELCSMNPVTAEVNDTNVVVGIGVCSSSLSVTVVESN